VMWRKLRVIGGIVTVGGLMLLGLPGIGGNAQAASGSPGYCSSTSPSCGGGDPCGTAGFYLDAVEWRYGADAGGTQATFDVEDPPLCPYENVGSASAAWVGLVNQAQGMIAQDGWAENYPDSSQGFYEYTTTDGAYHYFAINDSEYGLDYTYRTTFTASNGTFHFFQNGVQVGSTDDLGWLPYWNYVSTEVHYNSDYNAGDPSTPFGFSDVIMDGTSLADRQAQTEVDGAYQAISYTVGQSGFSVWDTRTWDVIVGGN